MNIKILIAAVVVILLFIVGIFIFKQESQAPSENNQTNENIEASPSSPPVSEGPDNSNLPTTSFGNIQFSVPDDFALATTKDQLPSEGPIPACDENFDYCIYYSNTELTRTKFESAGVRIQERKDLNSKDSCLNTQPNGYEGLVPSMRDNEHYSTTVFDSIGGGAAGHIASGNLYRVFDGSGCYEFETRVAKASFGGEGISSVTENPVDGTVEDTVDMSIILDSIVKDNIRLKSHPDELLFQ